MGGRSLPADPVETSDLAAATLGAIADAVVTLDAQGVITSCNPAAESIFGHPASEMVGSTLATVIPGEFRARHMAGFHAALASGTLGHRAGDLCMRSRFGRLVASSSVGERCGSTIG